jgi:predicted ATPase
MKRHWSPTSAAGWMALRSPSSWPAARVDAFGVHGLAARLGDPLQPLTGGRRPALPRHQTLRATLDWSHDLLSEPERRVLRRLAIFAAGFTLEAASAVAASAEITADEVVLQSPTWSKNP